MTRTTFRTCRRFEDIRLDLVSWCAGGVLRGKLVEYPYFTDPRSPRLLSTIFERNETGNNHSGVVRVTVQHDRTSNQPSNLPKSSNRRWWPSQRP